MMQHADRVDEVKTLERERGVVQIGLDHVNVARLRVASCDFDGGAQIDGPHFGAVLRGVISEAPVAATRVEDLLAGEEVGGMRLHVVEKLLLPLLIHLREAMPFVAKAARRVGFNGGCAISRESVTHRWEQQAWYAV